MKNLTAAVFIMKALISCERMSLNKELGMENEEWEMRNEELGMGNGEFNVAEINCCHCQTKQQWDRVKDLLPTSNAGNIC